MKTLELHYPMIQFLIITVNLQIAQLRSFFEVKKFENAAICCQYFVSWTQYDNILKDFM